MTTNLKWLRMVAMQRLRSFCLKVGLTRMLQQRMAPHLWRWLHKMAMQRL